MLNLALASLRNRALGVALTIVVIALSVVLLLGWSGCGSRSKLRMLLKRSECTKSSGVLRAVERLQCSV
ncbi:ABC-type proline/glycine betaine transport system ATPase subunit [Xanthomonas sp. 3498]|nr:ABC-type proline/glycine betaine transport system ATPase subunit [Xanthomonas sp. 3498]